VGEKGLLQVLPGVVSHASALAFLVVLMLFVPCAATVAVMKQEMGNWKWFASSMVLMLAVSFFGGMFAYHLALWTGL
jgi:ferrous iron transport protein B